MAFDISGQTIETVEKPIPKPETVSTPEAEVEAAGGKQIAVEQKALEPKKETVRPVVPHAVQGAVAASAKDPLLKKIEDTLADESIVELYNALSPEKQTKFKETGELLAKDIKSWIEKGKLVAHILLNRVQAWLRQIVSVNKWYVEQMAKIIVDNVLGLAEEATLKNVM